MSDVDDDPAEFTDEEKALEMSVICSGELTDDISDPADPSRKTASFTCAVPVLPQHIGIAVGPFGHVDLSEYRDTQDDERLGTNAIRVHAFCLPGREEEVRNSAMMLARTLDSFTERYQSYPFEKAYKLAFVDDLDCDVAHSASFSICSSRLLFPETVWEPLESTTRTLVHAVASQWIGINVTPQRPRDYWVIVGASWFMAELYLRELFGRNDHRFRQKIMVDKIIELDVRRPSLVILGEYLAVDPAEVEFMTLKAPMVLAILHHRLVKQSGRNGVDRCLYRLLFNARNEKLPNGMISTEGFLEICEKVGHQKLDTFFNQWIYGSGCPTFECHPVFNKKKQVIQLTIKQTQADPTMKPEERPLIADDAIREGKEKSHGFRPSSEWPAFVGPMTIRIHEADGTPYEHIVDINSSTVKVEIPYNTKYKRLKKSRRDKERAAAAAGLDASGEAQEDTIIYMLGDVLESREEMQEWRISEWSPEDEARMEQEFYEWLRVDADFEWICRTNINDMPAYMYVSQLQQDKDVMAQAEVSIHSCVTVCCA
jgi:transcription initiation factor TFIID subunit 2